VLLVAEVKPEMADSAPVPTLNVIPVDEPNALIVASSASEPSAKVNGSPVLKDGIKSTFTLLASKSSSALLFLLASLSMMTTGISSPELHSSSTGWMSTEPNPKPTRIVVGF